MSILKPTFSLNIGSLSSSTDNPLGGPKRILIERDMNIPADALQLSLMERSGIELGDDVMVKLGYDGEEQPVYTGKVVMLRPAIAGVEIFALGRMNELLNLRISSFFENQAAGSIAHDLINQAGLVAGTVDDGPIFPRYAVDNGLSAFAHLKALANRLGYELYTDSDGKVMFHALGAAKGMDISIGALSEAAGGVTYAFKQHLVTASADRQNLNWGKIIIGGESPMSGQGDTTAHWLTANDADYQGSAGDGAPTLLIRDPVARYKDLADRFAAGHQAVASREAYQILLTVMGQPQIDLGERITLTEVSDKLINGHGYVRAIRHRFGEDMGFITDFRISLSVNA